MTHFDIKDAEFAERISAWQHMAQVVKRKEHALEMAQIDLNEAIAEQEKGRQDIIDQIKNNGYPIVVPFGEENQGIMYSVEDGQIVARTVTVIPKPAYPNW